MGVRGRIAITLLSSCLMLSACGFALRGSADLAFHSLRMQGANLSIKRDLIKSLKVNGVQVVDNPDQAEVFLELMTESSQQNIMSISGDGTVSEYQIVYTVNYRVREAKNPLWGEVQTLQGKRDFTYDDTQLLAKQYEQERLLEDMRNDAVRSIMRQLVLFKPSKL